MMMYYFIEVIVPLSLNQTFTYQVSQAEFEYIQKGMRVAVPFGKSKVYTAMVIDKHHQLPAEYEPKEIVEILDVVPCVTLQQLAQWKWIAEYYMCTLGEVYRSALPERLLLESETLIELNANTKVEPDMLSDQEYLLWEALQSESVLKISDIVAILNKKTVFPIIGSLLEKGIVFLHSELIQKYTPKKVRCVSIAQEFSGSINKELLDKTIGSAKKQQVLLQGYFALAKEPNDLVEVKELLSFVDCSPAILKAVIGKGVFVEHFLTKDRVIFDQPTKTQVILSQGQQVALDQIKQSFEQKQVVLLHGVTASGKTHIYLELIEEQLKQGGRVLFLVPEIGLTTQLVSRMIDYFGNKVAVYTSKYSANERLEVWNQVLEGSDKASIVIGTRLAVFLPFSKLDLVIVDEEHEMNYKQQDPAPRYHGRDVAVVLAHSFKAKVLMGSATPSLEAYYNTNQGKYALVELKNRYSDVVLPEVVLVDIKDKYKRKQMTGHFSDFLIEQISNALNLKEQVILFQNRRGYASVLECNSCGEVPHCPNCDVSLTYHKFRNELRCHYCGYHMLKPTQCASCYSLDLTTKGFGTEQVELELKELFPDKVIARMDQDTTKGKYAYEKIIASFEAKEVDILVGTQMLSKGFDFRNVNLVGVLNADNILHHPDFRSHERAFQMMLQIAGRAGRDKKKGLVVIQTFNPYHNIIQQVTHNDYIGMFKEQMYERYNFKYPPFYRLIKLTLRHREYQKLKEGSMWLYNSLKQHFDLPILGPEEPAINRIRNQYIRVILIKIPQQVTLNQTKNQISSILKSFDAIGAYRSIRITVNVDFY